ncbi:MAG: sigma 54-interacting transcriptional regulator [Alphaproteobacteria bacterium]|nr:sigma 54-interacting transcriptional regulator [Alphaproteobacteria bacterium]
MRDHDNRPTGLFRQLPEGVIGRSPALLAAYNRALKVSAMRRPVLIRGPSGAGKTALATFIAERSGKAFVTEICANLTGALLGSQLFGHVRGAFTGAVRDRPGLLREADGGVLILDEIGKADLALQRRLLTLLEEGRFQPIGDENFVRVDVRVIAITCDDLEDLVEQGLFLPDLLFRLTTLTIHLPGLAERGDDVVLIARHLLAHDPDLRSQGPLQLDRSAEAWLVGHTIPGEVRGLTRLLIDAVLAAHPGRTLSAANLEEVRGEVGAYGDGVAPVAGSRKERVLEVLQQRGPCTAAELRTATGVPRSTLARWLRAWAGEVVEVSADSPPKYALHGTSAQAGSGAAPSSPTLGPLHVLALGCAGEQGAVAPRHLIEHAQVSRDTARRRIQELCAQGLLRANGKGRGRRYLLTPSGRAWLDTQAEPGEDAA